MLCYAMLCRALLCRVMLSYPTPSNALVRHWTGFVGGVNYSTTFHVSAASQARSKKPPVPTAAAELAGPEVSRGTAPPNQRIVEMCGKEG